MIPPLLAMAGVLAVLGGLIGGLRLWQSFASPPAELTRKLVHVGMGLVTLSFPWLFDEAWPVLTLAGTSVALLLALRLVRALKRRFGGVLGGINRVSLGEIYFPIAVAILFVLYLGGGTAAPEIRLVLYCIPVLLLTVADAVAALVGIAYGRFKYPTADGSKTFEGSIAFFTSAFFCVHVPLLLYTSTGRAETLLIALLLAWLATLFESVSWNGLDNLILPLVSYLLLRLDLGMTVEELVARLGITAALTVLLVAYQPRTTLAGSAVAGAFLVGYISWALGGWHWLVAPLVVFLTYTLLASHEPANRRRIHNVHAVLGVCGGGLAWLLLSKLLDRPDYLLPYTLTYAAQLAMIGLVRLRRHYPNLPGVIVLLVCVAKGWLCLFVPYLLAERTTHGLAVGALGVAAAVLAFYWTQPGLDDCPSDTPRWLRQALCAWFVSLLGLLPLTA
jgi:phytol kinase